MNILYPTEVEFYVESMTAQNIENLGTLQWFEWHQRLQKLNQQALLEASQRKDEHVKETLVDYGKTSVLVHEVILVNIWKHKVLPRLLALEPNPESSFIAYAVLFHEAVAVTLLELVLFHSNCYESLGDSAADLLDYSSGLAVKLLTAKHQTSLKESVKEELLTHRENLIFEIGIRVLTIIRYIGENMGNLPLSITTRIYVTHDIPMLLAELLFVRPWIKDMKQFSGGKWLPWDGEAVTNEEAQVWLALRQLLLDPACQKYYTITDSRRTQLLKLMAFLTPVVLDQLSVLIELKQRLSQLAMMEQVAKSPGPILLETVLEIKEQILAQAGGKWKSLARKQLPVIFSSDQEVLMKTAKGLSDIFTTDLMEFENKTETKCEQCDKNATQRCSRCKNVWYCSKSCQGKHWSQHKELCETV